MHSELTIIPTDGMAQEDFLKLRTQGLGGTDLAAICGYSPFKSPIEVYLEKTGQAKPTGETELMARGKLMEPIVADLYRRRTGMEVRPGAIVINPATFPIFGSIDRFVASQTGGEIDRGLEIKTATIKNRDQAAKWGEDGTDVIPDNYRIQVHTYLMVTGLAVFDLYALFALDDDRLYPIMEEDSIQASIREIGKEFWRRVELKDPPPPDATDEYGEYLRDKFALPRDKAIVVVDDQAVVDTVQKLKFLKREIAKIEPDITLCENYLKEKIGEHYGIEVAGERITWSAVESNKTDWKAISAKLGASAELIAEFTKANTTRRFNTPREWTKV